MPLYSKEVNHRLVNELTGCYASLASRVRRRLIVYPASLASILVYGLGVST